MSDKNANQIGKWFGNDLRYKEVNEDGNDLATPDTWHQLGHRDASEFNDEPVYEDVKADNGQVIARPLDERTPVFKGNVLQSNKTTLDFLISGCANKFFAVCMNAGKVNSKEQAIIAPICQFTPKLNLVAGTRKPSYEIKVRENVNSITIPSSELSFISSISANITIGASEYWYLHEES